jgi:hypothetical protein
MIKHINPQNFLTTPFAAVKQWELFNTDNPDVILIEPPGAEPEIAIALDYIDYTGNPILNRECDLALEQQETDLAIYQEGISGSGFFDPSIDLQNPDGTFKRLVYDQTQRSFYNQYQNPLKIFGMDNVDFPLSKTLRNLGNQFLLFTIPQIIMGDKLVPGTIQMYDTSLDDNITITDDGYGNLLAGNNIFSSVQEVRPFVKLWINGEYNNSCATYSFAPIGIPTLSASNVSHTASLQWTYAYLDNNGYLLQRSFNSGSTWSTILSASMATSSYLDTSLGLSTSSWYQVAAINPYGQGPFSPTASIYLT